MGPKILAVGLTIVFMMPYILKSLGREVETFTFQYEDQSYNQAFVEELAALSQRCGLQQQLREVGIGEGDLPMMARDAMNQTRLLVNNPRPVDEAAALSIYKAAW